jgi:hypothetical protein
VQVSGQYVPTFQVIYHQFDGIVFKQGGQGSTHSWYTRHCSAPVSKKRDDWFNSIFSQMLFFVCWLTNSTILNLTLMGQGHPGTLLVSFANKV